ncbi:unnamed protein product [Adineta ricciae]|uniref:Eukaryotic translation initiation factor 2 subunit 2 n=1 Tax=Adineta ricciae TaxID=249248 RepID=A0A814VYI9_ADIRI|nr:unnamed protein product [Adineta ricciae]CAF1194718.1 unnamed protein product [Adineta ricciae]
MMNTNENAFDEPSFDATRKKKSKKRIHGDALAETTNTAVPAENSIPDTTKNEKTNDSDYSYDYLISRLSHVMVQHRTEMHIPAVQGARIGTKRTSFVNFGTLCKVLQREEKQLQDYYTVELGVPTSIDKNHSLILQGRFTISQMENVLLSFIRNYVTCQSCRKRNTLMGKSKRLTMVKCLSCNSEYAVQAIQSGFQAQVGKRSANVK